MKKNYLHIITKIMIIAICLVAIASIFTGCNTNPKIISVEDITLNTEFLYLTVGDTDTLYVSITPTEAKMPDMTWFSSDPEVAIVVDGVVTAKSAGEATITVSTIEGDFPATCVVNVSQMVYPNNHIFVVANEAQWHIATRGIGASGNDRTYTINVTNDISIPGYQTPTFGDVTGLRVNVIGNSTISLTTDGSILRFANEQSITIEDISLVGLSTNSAPLVYAPASNAGFTMRGSSSVRNNGGMGVRLEGEFVGFTMYDGVISHNAGSGVSMTGYGITRMRGGSISDNGDGGINFGWYHSFIMYDGSIANNHRSGVTFAGHSTFNMTGGSISENRTEHSGGGVVVGVDAWFFMEGGTISGNIAEQNGGGVCGDISMSGGIISGNHAANDGGGIFIHGYQHGHPNDYQTILSGGTIYGSQSSGVPAHLANTSGNTGAALGRAETSLSVNYGDYTPVLPHTDGQELYTDHTVVGR